MPLLSPDVQPLWIAHYDYRPGTYLPLHSHRDHFQLISIVGGGGGHGLIGDTRIPLTTGQLFFLAPGRKHGLETSDSQRLRTLDTKFKIRHRRLEHACRGIAPLIERPDRRILPLLQSIHAEAQNHDSFSADLCRTLLVQILLLLLRPHRPGPSAVIANPEPNESSSHLSERLHRHLREHSHAPTTQKSLSRSFGYSYHQLHHVYRSRYGESPLRALRRLRIERAMQLIRYSDDGLKQIAKKTGFASVHHFTRVFTLVAGTSPARWRNQDCRETRRDVVIHPSFVNQNLVRKR